MIFNPTRIVIDLPNTTLAGSPRTQTVGGSVKEVRAGQFNQRTARLVIELSDGYTVNPQQVEVRGLQANQWVVQLPNLQSPNSAAAAPPNQANEQPTSNQVMGQTNVEAAAQLDGIVATGDGFLLQVSGQTPEPQIQTTEPTPDNRQIIIDLPNTRIAPSLQSTSLPDNRYSVTHWELSQSDSAPPTTRIVMNLAPASPDWRVLSNQGGVILLPPLGTAIGDVPDQPPPTRATTGQVATSPDSTTTPIPVTPPSQQTPALPPTATAVQELPQAPNGRIVVVIDPGHGGRDPGAVGINGLQEKTVIFPISQRVEQLLEAQGVTVVLTRNDDRTLDLQPRVDIAERANADVFVSIHANSISLSRPDVNGIESYYSSSSGQQLAAALQASMLAATGMRDRGVKQARFYVIRRTSMPAALVEVGFVTGAEDAPRLRDPAWRETMANAIARGILQYLQQTR